MRRFFYLLSIALIFCNWLVFRADAAGTVVSPYIEKDMFSVTWREDATFDNKSAAVNGAWKQRIIVGYGFTDWMYVGVGGLDEKTGGRKPDMDGAELVLKLRLTAPGEYWVDSGFLVSYKRNLESGPDNINAKLLLEKKIAAFENRVNLTMQRDEGSNAGHEYSGSVLASTRYLYSPQLQPGVEFQNQLGSSTRSLSFSAQSTQVGPALYGKLLGRFGYEAGYLFGATKSAPQGDAKFQITYSFKFN